MAKHRNIPGDRTAEDKAHLLIAAAAMLEVLQAVDEYLDNIVSDEPDGSGALLFDVRAAITAAEGRIP